MKNWLKDNYKGIIVGVLITAVIAGLAWPKREAKLQDGKEVAVETSINKYTAEFLYDKLKEKNGLTVLLSELDKDIINDKYGTKLDAEARESATTEAENYINQYKLYYQIDEDTFLSQSGYKDRNDFIENLMINYKINYYVNEYIASTFSESDIRTYYDSNVFGEKSITLISSTTDADTVKKAQKELKNGTSLDKVKKKYSSLVYNDLTVSYDTSSSFADVIINTIKNMKAKSVSDAISDDTYGTLAIYVSASGDKPTYDSIKDSLKQTMATSKQSEDQTLYYKAMIALRKEYGLKFNDAKYEEYYNNFNKQYAGQ